MCLAFPLLTYCTICVLLYKMEKEITRPYTRHSITDMIPGNASASVERRMILKKRRQFAKTFYNTIKPEDIEAVVRKLIEKAKEGNMIAIKEVLDRLLGKPMAEVINEEGQTSFETLLAQIQQADKIEITKGQIKAYLSSKQANLPESSQVEQEDDGQDSLTTW